MTTRPRPPLPKPGSAAAYLALLKPRVMTLVIFTGGVGLWMSGGTIELWRAALGMACLSLGAGAAGALNMWIERDADAKMQRTQTRPLPQGLVRPQSALVFATALSVATVLVMALFVDGLAALLLALANAYYVFVYTVYLKPRSAQNIVIGGAAGAMPPMIGWAMATGELSWISFSLFVFVFAWTPPHSWALALYRREDYAAGGFPMMPVVAGERRTKQLMLAYSVVMLASSLVPWLVGGTGWVYGLGALALGGVFVAGCAQVMRAPTGEHSHARKLFGYSILYLAVLFALAGLNSAQSVQLI